MLIVKVIGSDGNNPVEREIEIIPDSNDTIASLKEDLAYCTKVESEDQKLYHHQQTKSSPSSSATNDGNTKNDDDAAQQDHHQQVYIGSKDEDKTLRELGLVGDQGTSAMLLLVTPSSSFEATNSVLTNVKDDEDEANKETAEKQRNEDKPAGSEE